MGRFTHAEIKQFEEHGWRITQTKNHRFTFDHESGKVPAVFVPTVTNDNRGNANVRAKLKRALRNSGLTVDSKPGRPRLTATLIKTAKAPPQQPPQQPPQSNLFAKPAAPPQKPPMPSTPLVISNEYTVGRYNPAARDYVPPSETAPKLAENKSPQDLQVLALMQALDQERRLRKSAEQAAAEAATQREWALTKLRSRDGVVQGGNDSERELLRVRGELEQALAALKAATRQVQRALGQSARVVGEMQPEAPVAAPETVPAQAETAPEPAPEPVAAAPKLAAWEQVRFGGADPVDYSERIRSLRLQRKLGLIEMGKQIGCSDQSIRNWEKKLTKPQARYIEPMAKLLGVTPEELGLSA